MELTKQQLKSGLKYELDLSIKLKKEKKRIEDLIEKCEERMMKFKQELNK